MFSAVKFEVNWSRSFCEFLKSWFEKYQKKNSVNLFQISLTNMWLLVQIDILFSFYFLKVKQIKVNVKEKKDRQKLFS